MSAEPRVLIDLVSEDDIDGLFAIVTIEDMARAWVRYQSCEHPQSEAADEDPDWWAIELWWSSPWWRNRTRFRMGLLALVEDAETDYHLGMIGAGPLEDFVSDDEENLRWLESECARNAKLRRALATVWCSNDVSPATLDRLDTAAGVQLARLHRS